MKRLSVLFTVLLMMSCATSDKSGGNVPAQTETTASGAGSFSERRVHKNAGAVIDVFLSPDIIRKLSGWNIAVTGSADVLSRDFQNAFIDQLVKRGIAVVYSNHDITQEEINRQLSGDVDDDKITALGHEEAAQIAIKLILTRTRESPGEVKVRMSAANVASNMAVASMMELLALSPQTSGYSDIPLEGATPHDEVRDAALAIINAHVSGPNDLTETPTEREARARAQAEREAQTRAEAEARARAEAAARKAQAEREEEAKRLAAEAAKARRAAEAERKAQARARAWAKVKSSVGFPGFVGVYLNLLSPEYLSVGLPLQLGIDFHFANMRLAIMGEGGIGIGVKDENSIIFEWNYGGATEYYFPGKTVGLGFAYGLIDSLTFDKMTYMRFGLLFAGRNVKSTLYATLYGDTSWGVGLQYGWDLPWL